MKCWTCPQQVVAKHLCYRLPTGSLQWLYACHGCQTTYTAWYSRMTGPLGVSGMLLVHAMPRERQETLLLGEMVMNRRDPIAEAEATGDVILRSTS
jgi:hypothetical protein